MLELGRDMDDIIKEGIIDYMNLVFGKGEETEEFWNSILIPYSAYYFQFPVKDLEEHYRKEYLRNALYFSFIYLFGLEFVK